MSDQPNLVAALRMVAEHCEQLGADPSADMHDPQWLRAFIAQWCKEQAAAWNAERETTAAIGEQLYALIEADPSEQQYFELGALARHLTDKADQAATDRRMSPVPENPGEEVHP